MNIALIIAGGVGQRMQSSIPKQFLNVNDKPVLLYTMEKFQNHREIDKIYVVCLEGWEPLVKAYCKEYRISKFSGTIHGGKNGQDSIRNGLEYIAKENDPDDVVLVHDAIRPNVSEQIISDCLDTIDKHGNAVVVIPCAEAMLCSDDGKTSIKTYPRDLLKRTQTPQGMKLKDFLNLHKEALAKGITASVATCTLLIELGKTVYFSNGSELNLKLTTPDDLKIFKSLLADE